MGVMPLERKGDVREVGEVVLVDLLVFRLRSGEDSSSESESKLESESELTSELTSEDDVVLTESESESDLGSSSVSATLPIFPIPFPFSFPNFDGANGATRAPEIEIGTKVFAAAAAAASFEDSFSCDLVIAV